MACFCRCCSSDCEHDSIHMASHCEVPTMALFRAKDEGMQGKEGSWAETELLVSTWSRLNAVRALFPCPAQCSACWVPVVSFSSSYLLCAACKYIQRVGESIHWTQLGLKRS